MVTSPSYWTLSFGALAQRPSVRRDGGLVSLWTAALGRSA